MKALMSNLARRLMLSARRVPMDGSPFEFEGKTYRVVKVPAPRIRAKGWNETMDGGTFERKLSDADVQTIVDDMKL